MNKRLLELAEKSQLAELYDRYVEQCMKNADDDRLDYDAIVKEFAELIVKECCDVFVELRTRPADLAVKDVKKHFGVEE